jgi:hypothetical protein
VKSISTKEKSGIPVAGKRNRVSGFGHRGAESRAQQAEIHNILRSTGVQAKLTIGKPNDKYEQEADRVADQVMGMSDADVAQRIEVGVVQSKIQREAENEEEEEEMIQAKEVPGQLPTVSPTLESRINNLKSAGQPLDTATRSYFEPRFGHDFSHVRVHRDSASIDIAKSINARAFTLGNHVVMGEGEYNPLPQSGQRLMAHELAHVVQQNNGLIQRQQHQQSTGESENPLAGWQSDPDSLLLIQSGNRYFIVPAGPGLVVQPSRLRGVDWTRTVVSWDIGPFFDIPAVGAGGTRLFRAGPRLAIALDTGRGPRSRIGTAVYLDQLAGSLSSLGVPAISNVTLLHRHRDHYDRTSEVTNQYGLRPESVVIPEQFLRGARTRAFDSVISNLRQQFGPSWNPTTLNLRQTSGDVLRARQTLGGLSIEYIGLRSALRNVAANPDMASLLTRVTRQQDAARVVILGDLRGEHLERFRHAMEAARPGSWAEFFDGAQTISGFSHHRGRLASADIPGIMAVLDQTLLRTGRLRSVIQTNPGVHQQARSDTLELMRHIGIEVVEANVASGTGQSGVTVSRDQSRTRGAQASSYSTINSPLTVGLQRLNRLVEGHSTLQTWRPVIDIHGADQSRALDQQLRQIQESISQLRQSLRTAMESALVVRTSGLRTSQGARDYSGGSHGANYQQALTRIPATTPAEASIGERGFRELERLRNVPAEQIPLRIALHRALVDGVYSAQAFRFMLSQLDPATRNSLLTGRRGGRTTQRAAFQRVRAEFGFRQSVMPSGITLSTAGMSRPRARAARGVAWFVVLIELMNITAEAHRSIQISRQTARWRDIAPFLRRLAFWQQLRAQPSMVGVDDGILATEYERNNDRVLTGLQENNWNYFYIEHTSTRPALPDVEIVQLVAVLANNVRNYDEFATLFIDSDQDAVTWESPSSGGFEQASWKARVGRFETSGSNHIEERWVELPKLTELMRVYVRRMIRNTRVLLNQQGRSQGPNIYQDNSGLSEEGVLTSPSAIYPVPRILYRARLASVSTMTARVPTTGTPQPGYPGPFTIEHDIDWSDSNPVFYVWEEGDDLVRISGADYNTYIKLRRLTTRNYQHNIAPYGNYTAVRTVGNEAGTAWIDKNRISRIPN